MRRVLPPIVMVLFYTTPLAFVSLATAIWVLVTTKTAKESNRGIRIFSWIVLVSWPILLTLFFTWYSWQVRYSH